MDGGHGRGNVLHLVKREKNLSGRGNGRGNMFMGKMSGSRCEMPLHFGPKGSKSRVSAGCIQSSSVSSNPLQSFELLSNIIGMSYSRSFLVSSGIGCTNSFCHVMLCISVAYAVMRCVSVCPSARLSVSRSRILSRRVNLLSNFFHRRVATSF